MKTGIYFLVILLTGTCNNNVCTKQQFGLHIYYNKQICLAAAARFEEAMPEYNFACAEIKET